jgi:LysM repeat protein
LSLPNPPRLALLAGALAIAAIALFFLPALLGVGGGGRETPAPNPSSSGAAAPSQSVAPSEPAPPTQQVYTIKPGDTLSKVATDHGLTLEELLAANPTILDPDKIGIGDEVVIPTRPPDEFTDASPSPSPS